MKNASLLSISIICYSLGQLYAQSPPPLSFFPHHQGDIWEYIDPNNPDDYMQNLITDDSLGEEGRFYLVTTLFGNISVDTVNFEVHSRIWGGPEYGNLTYELAADLGDLWTVTRQGSFVLRGQVVGIYDSYVLGNNLTTIKEIDFTDSSSGLLFCTDYLASEFGLVGQDVDGFPVKSIRGAIINGVQYGTITSIDEEKHPLQSSLPILDQNFPNPFNSATMITYELAQGAMVDLRVYDITGAEVEQLEAGIQSPGTHRIVFEKSGLSSGMYVYVLKTPERVVSRKMLLLR